MQRQWADAILQLSRWLPGTDEECPSAQSIKFALQHAGLSMMTGAPAPSAVLACADRGISMEWSEDLGKRMVYRIWNDGDTEFNKWDGDRIIARYPATQTD
jgi:hypothetical protein